MPFALVIRYGVAALLLLAQVLVRRLLDEERFLRVSLPGYTEYTCKVRYRIVPYGW